MVRLILICLLAVLSYGNNIINISYFPSQTKIDVLLSLDQPFKGKVIYISKNLYRISGVSIDRIEQKKFKNGLNLIISGISNNETQLKLAYPTSLKIIPSVTAQGYGVRIRIEGFKVVQNNNVQTQTFNVSKNNATLSSMGFNWFNYILVILILIILMIVLLIVKKKTLSKLPSKFQKDNYKVLYQKMIDPKNKLVLIEVFDKRYLLLLGSNNVLLDNFSNSNQNDLKDISTQNGFESLLEDRLDDNTKDFINKASRLKELDGI